MDTWGRQDPKSGLTSPNHTVSLSGLFLAFWSRFVQLNTHVSTFIKIQDFRTLALNLTQNKKSRYNFAGFGKLSGYLQNIDELA